MNQRKVNSEDAVSATLGVLAGAGRFNKWMFERIKPYCGGKILEVGSGIGNLSHYLVRGFEHVTLSDVEPDFCDVLERRFSVDSSFEGVFELDLAVPDVRVAVPHLAGKFDTVIALNVIEHIANDRQAVSNCVELMKPGGHLVVLVPAYQGLYNVLDKGLGHYRRYTSGRLTDLLREQGLEVHRSGYFNAAGVPGWWLAGRVLRMKVIEPRFLAFYNWFVPVFRAIDWVIRRKAGLSVLAFAHKPAESN